jgi:CubicO group peptidase (beta-lactamase class C family)
VGTLDGIDWSERLEEAVGRNHIPGAVLGIVLGGERIEVAVGQLAVGRNCRMRADSIFQLGSISKVYTALLVMQLVEAGRLGLDDSLGSLLPNIRLSRMY